MRKNSDNRIEMWPYPEIKKNNVLIIGETVMMHEIQKGEYFISQGAETLRQTMINAGIQLEECSYTVAIPFIMNKLKTISAEAWTTHQNRLWTEIGRSGATVVMPLGTLATQMVLGDKQSTITKMLGNLIERNGVTIVPNYHPASLQHNPGHHKVFHQVIETVALMNKGYTRDPGVTKFEVIDSEEKFLELIDICKALECVACDIETNSLTTWKAKMWVIGFAVAKNETYVLTHAIIKRYSALLQQLFNLDVRFIYHGGKYDQSVLHWNDIKARLDEDTMLLHYALNETSGTHKLGQCATLYLGADEYKSKMNSEFSNIKEYADYQKYEQALIERVAVDADYTLQIFHILLKEVTQNELLLGLYRNLLLPSAEFVTRVQHNGCCINREYLESRVPEYEERILEATTSIQDAAAAYWDKETYMEVTGAKSGSDVFKPTSVKQLKYLVYDVLRLKPTIRHKRGETGAEVLESIIDPPEFIIRVLELRKIKKEFAAFCQAYLKAADPNELVHCTFSVHTTATGRLSCSDPNLQQVPSSKPEVRRAFIPRGPGRVIMEVDYSGAELRVLAWISQDETLIKAVTTGDLHSEVAERIFGADFTKNHRGIAKTVNFGIAYGRGAKDLAMTFGYPETETQGWIDDWAALYPKAWAYLNSCIADVKAGRALHTPYGRHRRMGLITPKTLPGLSNEAKNFRIQSISSDNTLLSAMEAEQTLLSKDAYIINLIHDSILIDCPGDAETIKAVADYMVETMEAMPQKQFGCNVQFHCDVDLGPNWGDAVAYDRATQTVKGKTFEGTYEDYYGAIIQAP